MDLRRFIEEKWVRSGKIYHFWAEHANGYRYPKLVPVPIVQRGSDTGNNKSGTGTPSQ